jgi:ABC-2 type transport system permease protein
VKGSFFKRLVAMTHKEILHIVRDVQVIYMALGMPVVLLFIFGYAISFDLDRLPVGLLDQDHSPEARRLVDALCGSDAFSVERHFDRPEQIEPSFRRGEIKAALIIPPDFGDHLARKEGAVAQLLLDGSNDVTATIALGYTNGIALAESVRLIRSSGLMQDLLLEARIYMRFNPGMRSVLFIVPGLMALILAILAVLLTALTVAREWEQGSMEQLFTTPVGRLEVILGKLFPYLLLGMIQVLLVVTLGTILFDVPLRGSLWLLFLVSALFLIGTLSQGLLISVITRNQQVATQTGMVVGMLPTMLLSGFLIPIENMPWPLQLVSLIVPARYFIAAMRGILLKGNDFSMVYPHIAALLVFALVMVALCAVRFKRRLD